ncbi:MAG TPA: hypothetical protein VF501_06085, partial [Thiobacillus sp.]
MTLTLTRFQCMQDATFNVDACGASAT